MTDDFTTSALRTLLREADVGPISQLDLEIIKQGGRRRRLWRRAAGATASAGVLLGATLLIAISLTGGATRSLPLVPASPSPTRHTVSPPPPPTPQVKASPLVTVQPGQQVRIGGDSLMWLTRSDKCVLIPPDPGASPNHGMCKSATDGNQGPRSVSLQTGGRSTGPTVITGIYTGTDAATILVTWEDANTGKTVNVPTTIVRLRDHPTFEAYYATTSPVGLSGLAAILRVGLRRGRQANLRSPCPVAQASRRRTFVRLWTSRCP